MVPYRSTVLFFTCASCLGFVPSPAKGFTHPIQTEAGWTKTVEVMGAINTLSVETRNFASLQPNNSQATERPAIGPGDRGPEVKELQQTLKRLGHYNGVEDGAYGVSTESAVSKFQESVGLQADGVVGSTTWEKLQFVREKPNDAVAEKPSNATFKITGLLKGKLKWVLLGLGAIALLGLVAGLFNLLMRSAENEEDLEPQSRSHRPDSSENSNANTRQPNYDVNGSQDADSSNLTDSKSSKNLAVGETTRLPKSHIIDELIQNLQQTDPAKRRQAIWELGRRGDSRAVQPLVNLMIDSDSKQRSLILAALSEIGTRTLTPMNRALAVSLQDENAEVRKNAIRDLTRIYELVTQMSQLLHHAVDDPDAEVQETARWALRQLNQIRLPPSMDNRHGLQNSMNSPSESAEQ